MSQKPIPPRPGIGAQQGRLAEILRVDHAGELGAVHIYRSQRAVLGAASGKQKIAGELEEMEGHEAVHLARFDKLLNENQVRPTAMAPLWRVAGFALGAATALLGPRAAMACTVAVETEIDRHYQAQRDALAGSEPELEAAITEFQAEEVEHRDTALAHGAESTPGYPLLSAIIRAGCRTAIAAARRV